MIFFLGIKKIAAEKEKKLIHDYIHVFVLLCSIVNAN